jgi:hypothetical protein
VLETNTLRKVGGPVGLLRLGAPTLASGLQGVLSVFDECISRQPALDEPEQSLTVSVDCLTSHQVLAMAWLHVGT